MLFVFFKESRFPAPRAGAKNDSDKGVFTSPDHPIRAGPDHPTAHDFRAYLVSTSL